MKGQSSARAVLVSLGAYILLHLGAAFFMSPRTWGVDAWSYLHPAWTAVFIAVWAGVLITRSRRIIMKALARAGDFAGRVPPAAWTIPAALVLFLGRQRVFLLGDGYIRIASVEGGHVLPQEALSSALHNSLHRLIGVFAGTGGLVSYRTVSIVCGVMSLYGLLLYLPRFIRRRGDRWTVGGLVCTAGITALFFGYVENYTLTALMTLLFLLSGLSMLSRGRRSLMPALFFALGAGAHVTGIVFAPALAYLYLHMYRTAPEERNDRRSLLAHIVQPMAVVSLVAIATAVVYHVMNGGPDGIAAVLDNGRILLPIFGDGDLYGILSISHLLDVANELALVAPAVAVIPAALFYFHTSLKRPGLVFTGLSLCGALVFIGLFNPVIGYARDWDIMAIAGWPATLFAALLLLEHPVHLRGTLGLATVTASLLHTGPWIAVNASERMTVERFETLAGTPYWTGRARAIAYESLGSRSFTRGDMESYVRYYLRAWEEEDNPRYFANAARGLSNIGDCDRLEALAATYPEHAETQYLLGTLCLRDRKLERAQAAFEQLVTVAPGYRNAYLQLGLTYAERGLFDKALDAYSHALENAATDADRALVHNNIAFIHARRGGTGAAIEHYRHAIALRDDFPLAHFNLAKMYYTSGRDSLARVHALKSRELGTPDQAVAPILEALDNRR